MDKIVPDLLRVYRNRAVAPVIVQAKHGFFEKVMDQLKEIVPTHLLEPTARTLLPRIFRVFEVPMSKWKQISAFNMIATVLTPNLVEEVAQWDVVEREFPDYIKFALEYPTVPEAGVFYDYRKEPFTTTYWVKRLLGLDRANIKGFDGRGIRVCVLDSGCEVKLPQVRHVKALTTIPEKGGVGVSDSNGHGTHVTSTVGGLSEIDRKYKAPVEGMAPKSDLHSIQCLGLIVGMGMSSDVLQAMEMALKLDAKVVNMSLGSEDSPPDAENPEAVAVNKLTENGVIVVVAAGNSGEPETIGSPGSCLNSLTVGAIDPLMGEIADFSSRGPTKGDGFVKPDVVSYGSRLNSQITGLIDAMVDPTQRWYAPISGTSMATPCVSGLVACMAQLYREKLGMELTVDEVKRMVESLGHPKSNDDGFGLLTWSWIEQWLSTEYSVEV